MNCHQNDFAGLGAPSPSSSNHHHRHNNTGGGNSSHHSTPRSNLAMSEIVIQHDVNQPLTTSYAASEVGMLTVEQQRRRQHNLAMAKAEAVTSRYSSICGLNPTLPVNQNRKQHQQQQQQQLQSSQHSQGEGGGDQPRRRRRSSAEPNYLALNKSFRKSFSSIASSDLPGDLSGDDNDTPPPPPPLKTDVTSLILTPKQEQQHQCKEDASFSPPECAAAVTDKVTNPPQKLPPTQQPRRKSAESSPLYPAVTPNTTKQHYRERPSFQATNDAYAPPDLPTADMELYHELLSQQEKLWQDTRVGTTIDTSSSTSNTPTSPPPASSGFPQQHHEHHHYISGGSNRSILSTMTIDEQAQMLREMQHGETTSNSPPHRDDMQVVDIGLATAAVHQITNHSNDSSNNDSSSKPPAVQEQEQLWRELSSRRHDHHHKVPTPPYCGSTAGMPTTAMATTPTMLSSPQEEQAQLWERIQQQHGQYQQQQSPPMFPGEGRTLRDDHHDVVVASTPMPSMRSPLEEQAHLMEEIQRNRLPTGPNSTSTTNDNRCDSTATAGLSAVEEQARMLRALELQRDANASHAAAAAAAATITTATMGTTSSTEQQRVNPVDQQANRLQEIQNEKFQQIVEMACKMSIEDSAPSLTLSSLSGGHNDVEEDDLSLQFIMDLSRREAEAQSQAENEIERALQVAMERSRGELNGSAGLVVGPTETEAATAAVSNNSGSRSEQQQAVDLELRRSIAELACQSSDGTLEGAEPPSTSIQAHRRRPWTFNRYRS